MKFHTPGAVVLFSFFAATSVCLEECNIHSEAFGWKGNNVKALSDCDILTVEPITLHLGSLVSKTSVLPVW